MNHYSIIIICVTGIYLIYIFPKLTSNFELGILIIFSVIIIDWHMAHKVGVQGKLIPQVIHMCMWVNRLLTHCGFRSQTCTLLTLSFLWYYWSYIKCATYIKIDCINFFVPLTFNKVLVSHSNHENFIHKVNTWKSDLSPTKLLLCTRSDLNLLRKVDE